MTFRNCQRVATTLKQFLTDETLRLERSRSQALSDKKIIDTANDAVIQQLLKITQESNASHERLDDLVNEGVRLRNFDSVVPRMAQLQIQRHAFDEELNKWGTRGRKALQELTNARIQVAVAEESLKVWSELEQRYLAQHPQLVECLEDLDLGEPRYTKLLQQCQNSLGQCQREAKQFQEELQKNIPSGGSLQRQKSSISGEEVKRLESEIEDLTKDNQLLTEENGQLKKAARRLQQETNERIQKELDESWEKVQKPLLDVLKQKFKKQQDVDEIQESLNEGIQLIKESIQEDGKENRAQQQEHFFIQEASLERLTQTLTERFSGTLGELSITDLCQTVTEEISQAVVDIVEEFKQLQKK